MFRDALLNARGASPLVRRPIRSVAPSVGDAVTRVLASIQPLESRRLMSAVPMPPDDGRYAAADDTYQLTMIGSSGKTPNITNAALDGISFSVAQAIDPLTWKGTKPSFSPFNVSLPSGANSLSLLAAANGGFRFDSATISSYTSGGRLREVWTLKNVLVESFAQYSGNDDTAQDSANLTFTNIQTQFYDVTQSAKSPPVSDVSWSITTATGSEPADPSAFASGYVATNPSIVQTLDLGGGQLPIGGFSTGVQLPQSGKSVSSGLQYYVVDGRATPDLSSYLYTGESIGNVVYTRRSPTTGLAAQRYRFSTVWPDSISISDSTLDDQPRLASVHFTVAQSQLVNYAYGTNGVPTQTSTGWDYAHSVSYNPGANAASVDAPADTTRNTPVDSVAFHFVNATLIDLNSFSYEGFDPAGLTLSAADGNRTWIVSGLAAQQTKDGHYAVKLVADKVNALIPTGKSASNLFIGSAAKSWTLDRSAPFARSATFGFEGPAATPYSFDFKFSEPVIANAADGTVPLLIRRADTGALVATANATIQSDGLTFDATLAATLADGRYRAIIPAGSVRDAVGNLLDADSVLPFFVLTGDANRDAKVDFGDLLILAKHYGQSGLSFADGNFDRSANGTVEFSDLLILAKRYGTTLPIAAAAAQPLAPAPDAPATRRRTGSDSLASSLT